MASNSPAADAIPARVGLGGPDRLAHAIQSDYRFIWRLLRRFGVPQAHAEDAAQQVFLVVAERLSDITPGRERAFAFGTAMRVAQTVRRKLGREIPHDTLDEHPTAETAPDALVEQKRARERLDAVLQAMPLEFRTVFILYELESLSSPEIALLIEVPLGTVASRLRRARELFRGLIAEKRESA